MAELADAPDLGSGGRPCRFDSCHPHGARASEGLGYPRSPGFFVFGSNEKYRSFEYNFPVG